MPSARYCLTGRTAGAAVVVFLLFVPAAAERAWAQGPGIVAAHQSYHRAYAVVPMTGNGTVADPLRPMFTAAPGQRKKLQQSSQQLQMQPGGEPEILSYSYQLSDDGKFALVEFVSATRAGLRPILESRAAGVVAFEQGRQPRAEIEAVFRGRKRDFDFAKFPSNRVR